MAIYPKVSEYINGDECVKEYIRENEGMEIQFLKGNYEFDAKHLEEVVKSKIEEFPMVKEITIHPPITSVYNIETLMFNNYEYVEGLLKTCISLSKEYDIKINLLFHVEWDLQAMCQGPIEKIKKLLDNIKEDDNVLILLENMYAANKVEHCTVLEIAKLIDNPKLKVCLDICHLHCQANIFKRDFQKFIDTYLDRNICEKYVYQIHFSATLNNDGIADKNTHGRMHENFEELIKDYYILKKFGMENKNIITEIAEEDYSLRKDQEKEIQMLMSINEHEYATVNKYA